MKEYDVIVSGYVSMDRIINVMSPLKVACTSVIKNHDNSQIYYGGCSINIAYALSKLGFKSLPYVRVGYDWQSNGFKNWLTEGGVSEEAIDVIESDSTSNCYIIENEEREHITVFYPGAMNEKYAKEMKDYFFKKSKIAILTVGSYLDNKYFYEAAKRNNTPLVFSLKADYNAFQKDLLWEILNYSEIIFMNDSEKNDTENFFNLKSITDIFNTGKAKIINVTLGKRGSLYYKKSEDGKTEMGEVKIRRCENVVDAVGSGDAYISGFIYGYMNDFNIKECCCLGATLASFVIQKRGCCTNIPNEEELVKSYRNYFIV